MHVLRGLSAHLSGDFFVFFALFLGEVEPVGLVLLPVEVDFHFHLFSPQDVRGCVASEWDFVFRLDYLLPC